MIRVAHFLLAHALREPTVAGESFCFVGVVRIVLSYPRIAIAWQLRCFDVACGRVALQQRRVGLFAAALLAQRHARVTRRRWVAFVGTAAACKYPYRASRAAPTVTHQAGDAKLSS